MANKQETAVVLDDQRQFYDPTTSLRAWVRVAAALANAVSAAWVTSAQEAAVARVRRVLVVRFDHLGDVLGTVPLIRALRARWPDAEIRMVVGPWGRDAAALVGADVVDAAWVPFYDRSLAAHNGLAAFGRSILLARRLGTSLRSLGADVLVDARGDPLAGVVGLGAGVPQRWGFAVAGHRLLYTRARGYPVGWHTSDAALSIVESPTVRFVPRLVDPQDARTGGTLSLTGRFALHVSGDDPARNWGPERDVELCRALTARGRVVLVGSGQAERSTAARVASSVPGVVNRVGRTSISELAKVLADCDVFIGPDSGPGHLAAHVGTPTVTMFGLRGHPLQFAPRSPHGVVLAVCDGLDLPPTEYWARMTVDSVLGAIDLVRRRGP